MIKNAPGTLYFNPVREIEVREAFKDLELTLIASYHMAYADVYYVNSDGFVSKYKLNDEGELEVVQAPN